MKHILIVLFTFFAATAFGQPQDTRIVSKCGVAWTQSSAEDYMMMECFPREDESVLSSSVYYSHGKWCYSVTFICTGINSKAPEKKLKSNPMDQSKNCPADKPIEVLTLRKEG